MSMLLTPITANGQTIPVVLASDYVDYRVLGVTTNESHDVPAHVSWALITPSTDIYAKNNAAATIPSGDVTDGSGSIYIPAGASRLIRVKPGGTLQMISPAASIVQIEFFTGASAGTL